MSDIEVQSPPSLPPRRPAGRDGFSSFIVLIAVIASVTMAAVALLTREAGEPLVLLALAVLAMMGVFFLFAASAGFVRFADERPNEDLLTAYADGLGEGVQLVAHDGTVTYTSSAFAHLLGAPAVDGHRWLEHVVARAAGGSEAVFRLTMAAQAGRAWAEEIELPVTLREAAVGSSRLEGRRRLRISVTPMAPASGEDLTAWRLVDVSRERATGASDLIETGGRAEIDRLPVGVIAFDNDLKITAINADLKSRLGLDAATLDGDELLLSDLIDREQATKLRRALGRLRRDEPLTVDVTMLKTDGAGLPMRLMLRPGAELSDPNLALAIERSVLDGAPAEDRFSRFFHAAPIAIATIDRDGRIGGANAAFKKMFGTTETAPGQTGPSLLGLVSDETRDGLRRAIQAAGGQPSGGPGGDASVEIGFGEGGRRSGRLILSAIAPADGEDEAAILYAIDTTQQKELEAQFAQSQKMQAVGQLAGGIAHDFNNVLTVIIGFSDLLLANHRPTDPAFRDIQAIKQNASRAAGLVRQLLAFSRRQTLRPEVLSLTDVISNFAATFARGIEEKVKLKVNHGRDLWTVKADVHELDRVIMNLAVNARDAMPEGGVLTITTRNLAADESGLLTDRGMEAGDYVLCEVSDTGTGMPPDIMAKIFEPFFSTKDVGKGTGLGLSTVYGIVKQTGGYIYCDSAPGKGTTFRIYLPRHVPAASEAVQPARLEKKERARDLTGTGTVLLVEDEEAVRRFAARALQRQGYAVLEAGNGYEALDAMAAHKGRVDLVVSDIVMPEMDGPTLLTRLRKDHPDLRIIFMSGYAEDALDSLDQDAEFAYLSKPFQLKDLVEKVKEVMQR